MFKKKEPRDELAKQLVEERVKVYANFNPYMASTLTSQIEIQFVENITIYHKKLRESRILGEFAKDKSIRKGKRKRIVKDVLKLWNKELKEQSAKQKKEILDKSTSIKKRRIKQIGMEYIYLFLGICLSGIVLLQKSSHLTKFPLVNQFIPNVYALLEQTQFHNLLIGLVYLSLFALLYTIVMRTYFQKTSQLGSSATKYIDQEFAKMLIQYKQQHKKLKKHLKKFVKRNYYKQPYKMKKVYDPILIINKLEDYGNYIKDKVDTFKGRYYIVLFLNLLIKVSVLGLTGYLVYIYVTTY